MLPELVKGVDLELPNGREELIERHNIIMLSDLFAKKKIISGQTKWPMLSQEMLPEIYGQRLKNQRDRKI